MNEVKRILTPGTIEANFDEMETGIRERLKEFEGAQFTEESRTMCKAIIADLRKEKTEISDAVKQVKKEWLTPFDRFKARADELIALYDEKINYLDAQNKEMEAKRIESKKAVIKEIYDASGIEVFALDDIYNPRWENATFKDTEIKAEMAQIKSQTDEDIQIIYSMNSAATDEAIRVYKATRKLSEALAYIQTAERVIARATEEKVNEAVEKTRQETIEAFIPEDTGEEARDYVYSFSLTDSAKETLETYLTSIGIEWEVLA